jgi:hypothetical protein
MTFHQDCALDYIFFFCHYFVDDTLLFHFISKTQYYHHKNGACGKQEQTSSGQWREK